MVVQVAAARMLGRVAVMMVSEGVRQPTGMHLVGHGSDASGTLHADGRAVRISLELAESVAGSAFASVWAR